MGVTGIWFDYKVKSKQSDKANHNKAKIHFISKTMPLKEVQAAKEPPTSI